MKTTFKPGDRVRVTAVPEVDYPYFSIGDIAILLRQDEAGNFWADFEERHGRRHERSVWCLQKNMGTRFEKLTSHNL
jgi:hypothetical protein